jgi:hypothetical protein
MIELDLDRETLDCLGMRLANDEWGLFFGESNLEQALAALVPTPQDADLSLFLPVVPQPIRTPREVVKPVGDLDKALGSPAQPKRRVRRPTLASQLLQIWKAARAAGVHVAVTVEAGKVTATPVNGGAIVNSDNNEWDRDLGTNPPEIRQ